MNKKITIAMPVYNEQSHIEEAIYSIINQAGRIIICDNASTDKTSEIAAEFAAKYDNVEHIRHETNIGAVKNFYYPLTLVDSEYFMWFSGHDLVDDNYVESLSRMLESCNNAVLAYPSTQEYFASDELGFQYDYWYHDQLSSDDPFKRAYALISNLYNCFLIHGVFRTEFLKKALCNKTCIAVDHIILTKLSTMGRFLYYPYVKIYERVIRVEDSQEVKSRTIKDLTGDSDAKLDIDPYLDLKNEQYKIIKKIKTKNKFKKLYYMKKAKKTLKNKWGNF